MTVSEAVAKAQAKALLSGKVRISDEEIKRRFSQGKSGIAVDKAALDAQVREKQAINSKLKDVDDYYTRQALEDDKHAVFLHKEQVKEQRQRQREVMQFYATHQGKEQRREWDINNPKQLKNDPLPRVEGVPCPTSSLQEFAGEDPDLKNRKKAQAHQNNTWNKQQISEKNLKLQREKQVEALGYDRSEQVTHKAWQIEKSIAARKAESCKATAEFNRKLAEQNKRQSLAAKDWDTQCSLQEIQNMLDSDLLNEVGSVENQSVKTLGPTVLRDVQVTQATQRAEKAEVKKQERLESLAEARQEQHLLRMATALERARARQRREQMINLGKDRKLQVSQAMERKREALEYDTMHTATGYSLSIGSKQDTIPA